MLASDANSLYRLYNGPDIEDELPKLEDWLESPVKDIYE
jgi:hypothetical protein